MQNLRNIPLQPPAALLRDVVACGLNGPIGADKVNAVPATAGAYALVLGLGEAFGLALPRAGHHIFKPGWYIYAGSARGPGGMRARLARHFRTDKRPHWHIDRLTSLPHARVLACAAPVSGECDLIARLSRTGHFNVPYPGFGSSDCRLCESHLLMWTEETAFQTLSISRRSRDSSSGSMAARNDA